MSDLLHTLTLRAERLIVADKRLYEAGLLMKAANEIERLRAELERMERERDEWQDQATHRAIELKAADMTIEELLGPEDAE